MLNVVDLVESVNKFWLCLEILINVLMLGRKFLCLIVMFNGEIDNLKFGSCVFIIVYNNRIGVMSE